MAKKKVVEAPIIENINNTALDELMGERFGIYAKDVIQERAIPDARDGLKPVQRRIIFDMAITGNTIDKPTKKSAHIVGDVMGKYHPHGDASIYDALAHLSQNWRLRYPLVDFQGNNGSMDGDEPAAPRYTEARLSAISNELVRDLDMETVDMELTYDDSSKEPTVLPSYFPNLFANGSTGIAVGIATEIPPHNLKEINNAIIYRIRHPKCTTENLLAYVPGPDFPTGGIVYEGEGLKSIYLTGRGHIDIASKTEIIDKEGEKQIIITEIPYGVIKSKLVFQIDKLRHDKVVAGIDEVRDETDKTGLRIAIDLKDNAKPEALLKYLMNKTDLRCGYSANMVAIVDQRPKTMTLLSYCDCYIAHRSDVVTRRSRFLLTKEENRLAIVEGLIKAVSVLDQVVMIIRKSKDKADSKKNLSEAFGFSEPQAEAIVMMPLYKLSHTDIVTLENERDSLNKDIAYLKDLLSDHAKILDVIVNNLKEISKKYGDERRTSIQNGDAIDLNVDKRDLIAEEDTHLVVSHDGYLKRSSVKSFVGSGGNNGAKPGKKPGDVLIYNGLVKTTDYLFGFTNKGNYVYIPVNEVKEAKWNDIGGHMNAIVSLSPDEKVVRCFAIRSFRDDLNVVLLTKRAQIKRIKLSAFPVARNSKPVSAIKLSGITDELVDVSISSGNSSLLVMGNNGLGVVYNENEIPLTNPRSGGIKAGNFRGADAAALLSFAPNEKEKVLLLTDRGHTRVVDASKIEITSRLKKSTVLFNSFKSEPHTLIYAKKAEDLEAPFVINTILGNGEEYKATFTDFYLTPADKYAKRPENFPSKDKIVLVEKEDYDRIDENTVSYEPSIVNRSLEDIQEPSISSKDSFEQISLFNDGGNEFADDDDSNDVIVTPVDNASDSSDNDDNPVRINPLDDEDE